MQNYIVQGNFTAGELSPLLRGRADTEMFFNGATELYNCSVLTQGGVQRRPGTKNLHRCQRNASYQRLFKMQITENEAYIVQLTDEFIHIIDVATDTEIAAIPNHPYLPEEFDEITCHQSIDVLFLAHRNHPLGRLANYGGSDWRYTVVSFSQGPFLDRDPEESGTALSLSRAEDRLTVTSSMPDFASAHENSFVEYRRNGVAMLGKVVSKVSSYSVIIEPLEDRCYNISKEVYSPGVYKSWDGDNGIPVYGPLPAIGVIGKIAFSAMNVVSRDSVGGYIRFSDEFATYRWVRVDQVDDILQSGAYGILAVGPILRVYGVSSYAIQTLSERVIRARMYCSDEDFFLREHDAGRYYRLGFGETTIYAKVLAELGAEVTRTGDITANDQFIAVADISRLSEGMEVRGYGIPENAFVTKVQESQPERIEYETAGVNRFNKELFFTGLIKGRSLAINRNYYETRVKRVIPAVPSGVYISYAPTATIAAAELVFGDANTISMNSVMVTLSRTVPRAVDGINLYNGGTADVWYKGAFFIGNYPGLVGVHEERLVLASSNLQPQTLWLSNTGDYFNFAPVNEQTEVLDSNAITVTIGSPQLNRISWMSTKNQLCFGTTGGEWVLGSGAQKLPLTPRNVSANTQTAYGSVFNAYIDVGRETIFIQNGGERMRQMRFDYSTDGFVSKDLTVRSDHFLSKFGGARELVFAQNPNPRIFVRSYNGDLLAFTYEPDQEVYSWSHFISGACTSMVCVQRGASSVLYLSMIREVMVDGLPYHEYFLETLDLSGEHVYIDNHRHIGGDLSVQCMSFANKDVVFVTDTQHSDLVRADITGFAPAPAGFSGNPTLHVGLPYETRIETYPLEAQSQLGPGMGRFQSIIKTTVRLHQSGGFEYAVKNSLSQGMPVVERSLRTYGNPMDASAPLSSDDHEVQHAPSIGPRQTISIKTSRPWPLTILALCHTVDQK